MTEDEGKALAHSYKIPFYETSAMNAANVQKAYMEIATTVARRVLPDDTVTGRQSLIRLRRGGNTSGKKTGCC